MPDYGKMTQQEFDELLAEVLDEGKASALLSVPGVYEAVSEHFNNEVLDRWAAKQPDEEDD